MREFTPSEIQLPKRTTKTLGFLHGYHFVVKGLCRREAVLCKNHPRWTVWGCSGKCTDVKEGEESLRNLRERLGGNISFLWRSASVLPLAVLHEKQHALIIGCNLAVPAHSTDACCIASSLHGASSFLKNEIIINSGSFYGIIKMSNRIPLGN